MYRRYRYTFDFCDTEAQAIRLCSFINKTSSYYMRKNKPAGYTPWQSADGKENKFVVFYYT